MGKKQAKRERQRKALERHLLWQASLAVMDIYPNEKAIKLVNVQTVINNTKKNMGGG